MTRIRHCACRHFPERAEHFFAQLAEVGLSVTQVQAMRAILYGAAPAGNRLHDRALTHVSAPDPNGHMHWTGARPLTAGPRVQYQGRRMPVAHWLWLREGRPDIPPLVRTCHDSQCIAPSHHDLAREPRSQRLMVMHAALARFDAENPRINFRPKTWDHSDPTRVTCLRAGHPLTIYGEPKMRSAYCSGCAYDERKRQSLRAGKEAEINALSEGPPTFQRVDYADGPIVEDIPDGPSLVDQLIAEGFVHVD